MAFPAACSPHVRGDAVSHYTQIYVRLSACLNKNIFLNKRYDIKSTIRPCGAIASTGGTVRCGDSCVLRYQWAKDDVHNDTMPERKSTINIQIKTHISK